MKKLIQRAIQIRKLYEELEKNKYGRSWTPSEIAQGFVGDVGDLQKLVMAKAGIRQLDNIDEKLRHELADCLWSIIILADKYEIDLEQAFAETMDTLEKRVKET